MISSRPLAALALLLLATGCTTALVGGDRAGAYHVEKDEREPGVVASDAAITTRIKGKYATDPVVSVFEIGVRTWNGTVTLTGAVGSFRDRDTAAEIARDTDGVRAVNNLIEIEDRSQPN